MIKLYNGLGLVLALLLASLAGVGGKHGEAPNGAGASPQHPDTIRSPSGTIEVRDQSGHVVPLKHFQRIASASTAADSVLLDLLEPDRIVAFTAFNADHGWSKHRYAGKARIESLANLETIIALKPDLLLANVQGSEQQVARLEEAGIAVFDLGAMSGVSTFERSVRDIALLIGRPELGERYLTTFRERLGRISADLPAQARKSAAYVAVFGQKLFGSGRDTSFADVLAYAGLIDKGAERYDGFPEYGAEQLLALDPDLIVTHDGMRAALCGYPGLEQLRACADPLHRVVELPETILGSTGAEMLIAAESLHDAVYGAKTAASTAGASR